MKTSKEKELFGLVANCDVDNMDGTGIGVHLMNDMHPEFDYRVYGQKGYCLDIKKEHQCEPNETEEYNDIDQLHNDGCTYYFYSWDKNDGFNEITIDEALDIFKTESVQL